MKRLTIASLFLLLCACATQGSPEIDTVKPTEGSLDKGVIDEYIKRHMRQLRACYEKEQKKHPKLEGKVNAHFVIDGSGRVVSAELVESTLKNKAVEACVLGVFQGIVYPEPKDGGTIEVDYPLSFSPSIVKPKTRK
jgi:TonB family protein